MFEIHVRRNGLLVVGVVAASVALGVAACGGAAIGTTPEACAEKVESCVGTSVPAACVSTCDQECIGAASCDEVFAAVSGEKNALATCLKACANGSTTSGSAGSSSSGSGTGGSDTGGSGTGGIDGTGGATTGGGDHDAICQAVAANTVACCPSGVPNCAPGTESDWVAWCEDAYDTCPQSFECQAASSDCNDDCPTIGNGGC